MCEDLVYIPKFSVKKVNERFVWILDHGKKIILVDLISMVMDLRRFRPSQKLERRNLEVPRVLHDVTIQGARILLYWWAERAFVTLVPDKFSFDIGNQAELRFMMASHTRDKTLKSLYICRLYYDAVRDTYVIECLAELSGNNIEIRKAFERRGKKLEFTNFQVAGAADDREEYRRWGRGVFHLADDKYWYVPHQNVTISDKDPGYLAPSGSCGFFDDKRGIGNPVIEILESNLPVWVSVCYALMDQHMMVCLPPEKEMCETKISVRFRLLALGQTRSKPYLQAKRLPITEEEIVSCQNKPLFHRGINDFEEAIDPNKVGIAATWRDVDWDRTVGHSGKSSLRLTGTGSSEKNVGPWGPYPRCTPGKRFKFGGYVKTEDLTGEGAYITVRFSYWNEEEKEIIIPPGTVTSEKVTGTSDWTYVEVPVKKVPAGAEWAAIGLAIKGIGTAWFDDLVFFEK